MHVCVCVCVYIYTQLVITDGIVIYYLYHCIIIFPGMNSLASLGGGMGGGMGGSQGGMGGGMNDNFASDSMVSIARRRKNISNNFLALREPVKSSFLCFLL